ncbi:MAG: electron transfer flavoprotein subunit alpha/FixB family protein [Deltaproteobacteria bacterium]|nr:electron transfer flavoprotein subunit alpha/FixB family protein [Deltaproteobacteria bacterium]
MIPCNVLIFAEHKGDQLDPLHHVLVSKGRILADKFGGQLVALVLGKDLDAVSHELRRQCVDVVAVVEGPSLVYPEAHQVVKAVQKVSTDFPLRAILLDHSHLGIEVGSLLSVIRSSTFIGNCLEVDVARDGHVFCIRPMYGGVINVKFRLDGEYPSVLTLRPQPLEKMTREYPDNPRVVHYEIEDQNLLGFRSGRVLETIEPSAEGADLSKARIVIGVGRGIGTCEQLQPVFNLAESLGALVACSRPIVDVGWLPPKHLVGISGATISPIVYIALGISGAAQHLAGMINSELIIAVNKDPLAPIFSYAHYGLVADLKEVIPILKDEVGKVVS